ncbi:MAG: ABC transporter permease [Ignavibacteria bacterium]|nr:ABC transporter permease [Ignavibacteria bacterium]
MMLLKLAQRNIWRNKRRSVIVIVSVAVGITATILTDTLSMGMIFQMFDNQIGSHIAHMQIHRNGFRDNMVVQNFIPDAEIVERAIKEEPSIAVYSRRVVLFGLLSSANTSAGISIIGIEPTQEAKLTKIKSSIVSGSYLTGSPNEIVIGRNLAEKLGVELGDKVVALSATLDGHVGSDVFRIVGVFETFSSEFDKVYAYVPLEGAQKLVGLGNRISEIAILTTDRNTVGMSKEALQDRLGDEYEVLSYVDLIPLILVQIDMYQQSMIVFYAIIGIALILGIVNTMLMSVFERIQEIGVLMAIGLSNAKIFSMILIEALSLGILGTGAGFVAGVLIYLPLASYGIDLSAFSEGLKSFGTGTVIYPVFTATGVLNALFLIPFMTVLGALYPAYRAIRLQPINAIRFV